MTELLSSDVNVTDCGEKRPKGGKKGRKTQKASRGINQRFKKRRRNEKNKYIIVPVPVVENILLLPLNFFLPLFQTNLSYKCGSV